MIYFIGKFRNDNDELLKCRTNKMLNFLPCLANTFLLPNLKLTNKSPLVWWSSCCHWNTVKENLCKDFKENKLSYINIISNLFLSQVHIISVTMVFFYLVGCFRISAFITSSESHAELNWKLQKSWGENERIYWDSMGCS